MRAWRRGTCRAKLPFCLVKRASRISVVGSDESSGAVIPPRRRGHHRRGQSKREYRHFSRQGRADLLFLGVTLSCERDQTVEQLRVGHTRRGPHLGILLIVVSPDVLISSRRARPSRIHQKSTRAMPAQSTARYTSMARRFTSAATPGDSCAGMIDLRVVVQILGLVVVKLAGRNDFARTDVSGVSLPSTAISISRAFGTAASMTILRSNSAAVDRRRNSPLRSLPWRCRRSIRDSRLDEHGIPQPCGHFGRPRAGSVMPVAAKHTR